MASLTTSDLRNLALYTLNQKKVFRRNELLEKAPHIGSHTVTRIWRCTDEYVYRDPIELDGDARTRYEQEEGVSPEQWESAVSDVVETAIVCDWRFDETGCNTISCNPYYPGKGTCNGYHETTEERENPFAFKTANGQRVDACQPVCYDEDRANDNYVGMTSLYANRDRSCFVTDPELLAYYLDPHRRISKDDVDSGKAILEKSAFEISKEYFGATGAPVVVARINEDYCEQYGLDYVSERSEGVEDDSNGEAVHYGRCKTDKNEGGFFSLSTWVGDTATRAYNFGRADIKDLIKKTGHNGGGSLKLTDSILNKGPPTLHYLTDDRKWKSHIDTTKRRLPFPVKLSYLGLKDVSTDGLMWTDEYSFLDDGRNDRYGGRLVERPRDPTRPIRSLDIARGDETAVDDADNHEETETPVTDDHDYEAENEFLLGLTASLTGMKEAVAGTSYDVMVDQMVAGTSVDMLGDLFTQPQHASQSRTSILHRALKSSLRRMAGKSLSNRAVGLAVTQTAIRSRIESTVVKASSSLLKLPFHVLSRGANALSVVQLLGTAVDLVAAFVYDPYREYQGYVSDRLLRALARAELVATQRLVGRQRLTLDPFEWMVNTRFLDPVKDSTYDMLLGMMYTRARRVNGEGSVIYWYKHGGGLRRDDDGRLLRPGSATATESISPRLVTGNDPVVLPKTVTESSSSVFFAIMLLVCTLIFFVVRPHRSKSARGLNVSPTTFLVT